MITIIKDIAVVILIPASRDLSQQEKNERKERPLQAPTHSSM